MYEYDFDVETCSEIVEIVQRTFTKCHQHISSSIQQNKMNNDELYHNVGVIQGNKLERTAASA
jgi:hypothetical protein